MEGQEVIGQDDHKIGTIVAERDGIAIVEVGHVFKSKYAIPQEFLHEHDDVMRATVAKEIVTDSPKLDDDSLDVNAVRLHYGLIDITVVDPDPEEHNAETEGVQLGLEPAPHKRLRSTDEPALDRPLGFDRTTNSADPGWQPAGTSGDSQRDDAIDRDEHLGDPPKR